MMSDKCVAFVGDVQLKLDRHMPTSIGFGIFGWGNIAPFHAKALAALPNVRLAAVATKPEKFAAVRAEVGPDVALFGSLDELLASPNVDVVNICTPSGNHLEPTVAAAKAGKHVVVEKPLEVTLARCDRTIAACRSAGVSLCTIFPTRFADATVALKSAIDAGRFGNIALADTSVKWWRPQSYYDSGGWRGTWKLDGGGALMNQAIHQVDLIQYLLGPVTEVAAFCSLATHARIEVEDTAVAILRFANGAVGTITAATSAFPGLLKTVAVHGDGGSAVIEQDHALLWKFATETPDDDAVRARLAKSETTGGAADPKAIAFENHRRQLADFVAAIRDGRPPLVDGSEGRKAVEIILAIYRSQATGQIVRLPLAEDPEYPKYR
jgi:predicted dehydrogenase